ncbi:MAG: hypothetical protein WCE54_16355 [Ignavibacteriaceae bacterium]
MNILILLALFFLGGCEKKEVIEPLTNTQKEALNYLPGDSRFVMFLNLTELRKTNFWDNYFKSSLLENNLDNQQFRKFEKGTGIGLNKGMSQIFISSNKNYRNAAVIILDKNSGNIKNSFDNYSGFLKENIYNKPVYMLKGKFPLQFYFVNDSILLVSSSLNYIKTIINKKNISLNNNREFIGAINSIRNKKQYWIATDKGQYAINYIRKFFNFEQKIPVNNVLKSIKSVTLSAEFDNGLDIESRLNCSDSKNAYLLSTAIKGALAMDLLSGGDYSFGKILQKTDVERLNKQINLQLELKGDEINTLKDFAKQKNLERKL